jgi:hypothetical protein
MISTRLTAASLVAASIVVVAPAHAQQPLCGERASLVTQLERKYGEARRAVGLQGGSVMLEVFASNDTGTWTILLTRPDGVTCAMAAGEAWREENGAARRDPPA